MKEAVEKKRQKRTTRQKKEDTILIRLTSTHDGKSINNLIWKETKMFKKAMKKETREEENQRTKARKFK